MAANSKTKDDHRIHIKRYITKKIESMLFVDQKTIYRHLANIRKEIGVHSTIELLNFMTDKKDFIPNIIKLTPRGREIFQLTLTGKADKQIGNELGISYNCARRHKEKW